MALDLCLVEFSLLELCDSLQMGEPWLVPRPSSLPFFLLDLSRVVELMLSAPALPLFLLAPSCDLGVVDVVPGDVW